MKRSILAPAIVALFLITGLHSTHAQKVYSVTSGEMIFGLSNVELADEFVENYPDAEVVNTNLRYTIFFHFGNYWHVDFANTFGLISGVGIRNVGLISDEYLPETALSQENFEDPNVVYDGNYRNYKVIRRSYMAGIPLMIKIGSFKDNIYFFAGGEYELAFQFKEKYWSDTHSRDGSKTKYTEWFGDQVPTFLPSLVGGIQLPKGIHIKFKYYMDDFLNNEYGSQGSSGYSVSNLKRYATSQVYYFSISWQFNTAYITEKDWQTNTSVAYNR